MNTLINNIIMDGQKLELITPTIVTRTVDSDGFEYILVAYHSEGDIFYLPLTLLVTLQTIRGKRELYNALQLTNFSNPMKHEIPVEMGYKADRMAQAGVMPRLEKAEIAEVFTTASSLKDKNQVTEVIIPAILPPEGSRTKIVNSTLRPNPHLDKDVLTKTELQEVLLWALDLANQDSWPVELYNEQDRINTSPNSALTKLAAFLGTLVYGPNNYIGPSKTGDLGTVTLEEAVTTIPALSEADAQARAHDIALAVNSSPLVDNILPPIAKHAQVFRPYFSTPPTLPPVPQGNTVKISNGIVRSGATNRSLLKLAGDVEENPGPPKRYGAQAAEEERKLYTNPKVYAQRLNLQVPSFSDYERAYIMGRKSLLARSAQDEQTDVWYPDDGLANWTYWSHVNVPTPLNRVDYTVNRLYTWAIRATYPKEQLPYGKLGSALKATLSAFPDYLSLQRTNTNSIAGNPELNIMVKTPLTDYGCYVPIVKLLLYEFLSGPLSGSPTMQFNDNMMQKHSGAVVAPAGWFPNTVNVAFAAPPVVNAWAISTSVLSAILGGNLIPPAAFPSLDSANTAVVIVNDELNPEPATYWTICHLEWPLTDETIRTFNDSVAGVFNRLQTAGSRFEYRSTNYIPGPRDNVVYILTHTSQVPGVVLAGGTVVTIWDDPAAAPPIALNIAPALVAIEPLLRGGNNLQWSIHFQQTMAHALRFADLNDWNAACSTVGSMIFSVGNFSWLRWNDTAANSGRWIVNGIAPTVTGAINQTQPWDIPAANQLQVWTNIRTWFPFWNDRMMLASVNVNPAAGVARGSSPTSGWLQDSPWLTKLGIFKDVLAKNTLGPKGLDDYTVYGLCPLFYAIKEATLLKCAMSHTLVQEFGLTVRDVLINVPRVVGNQYETWEAMREIVHNQCVELAGWQFLEVAPPQLDIGFPVPPLAPAGAQFVTGQVSYDWAMDCPLYFYNPLLDFDEKTLGLYPLSGTGFSVAKICNDWKPMATAASQIYGTASGGANSICSDPEITSDGDLNDAAKNAWALSKFQDMNNPQANAVIANSFLTRPAAAARAPVYMRARICTSLTGSLRWIFDQTTNDQWLFNSRYKLYTMPFFPPALDTITGQNYAVSYSDTGVVNGVHVGVNISGVGSSTYIMMKPQPGFNRKLLRGYDLKTKAAVKTETPVASVNLN